MLGGYYLGQLYLGISGLPDTGTLSVQSSSHQLSSDNITITQKHTLVTSSAVHSLASDNVTIIQKFILKADDTIHNITSDNVSIISFFDIRDKGIYIKDFGHSGFIKSRFNVLINEDSDFVLISEDGDNVLVSEKYELPNIGTVGTRYKSFGDITTADIHIGDALKSKSGSNGYIKSIFNTLIDEDLDFVLISEDGKSVLVSEIYDTSNPDASLKPKYIHNGALKQSSSNKGVYKSSQQEYGRYEAIFQQDNGRKSRVYIKRLT